MTARSWRDVYAFVYQGQLTDAALDAAGRSRPQLLADAEVIAEALSIELLDSELVESAQRMSIVYTAIAAFENAVRDFVFRVLIDAHGEDWWNLGVSEKIRKAADSRRIEEEKTKWHGVRGSGLLNYTELGHLPNIMQQNWELFEPYVQRIDWATAIFSTLERSRNVIMHSGTLDIQDIERIGIYMRDWNKQVGL